MAEPINLSSSKALSDEENKISWFEEQISDHLKWSYALNSVLYQGSSKYQNIALLNTKPFGKVLLVDGKVQISERDEFIYHECLIHPALLCHPNPRTVFLMGAGEGSGAREALKHKNVERVVMCDIDQEVVDCCFRYLSDENQKAFRDKRLHFVINDARIELEERKETFDVIVGDLPDPVKQGPCYQLYTESFYQSVLKPKLNYNGIFATQAGPAGVLTHKEVFSSIYNTLKHVFKYVVAYTANVPSYADTWGWVMASDQPLILDAKEIDSKIAKRINGELRYLNGESFISSTIMNKTVQISLLKETHIYTEENARFIHGSGKAYSG